MSTTLASVEAILSSPHFRLGPLLVAVDGQPWTAHSDGWVIFATAGKPTEPVDTSEHATPKAIANVQAWLHEEAPNSLDGAEFAAHLAALHCSRCEDRGQYPCAICCEEEGAKHEFYCEECDGSRVIHCNHHGETYGRIGGVPFNLGLTKRLSSALLQGRLSVGVHQERNYGKTRATKNTNARLLIVGPSWRFVQSALKSDVEPNEKWHDFKVSR